MAGISLGAQTPDILARMAPQGAALGTAPASRRRVNHGVCMIGGQVAGVYSSRRDGDGLGVTLTIGGSGLLLTGSMTPMQARALARALTIAAGAAEVRGGAR